MLLKEFYILNILDKKLNKIRNNISTMEEISMGNKKELTIIHFNDVYEIEEEKTEPIGGAARFCTALELEQSKNKTKNLVLFSGDGFSPSAC